MDKREARQYVYANPPADPFFMERRPSFLGRLFSRSRSSSMSEDGSMLAMGMQRRGSIDPPDVSTITQKLQQQVKKPAPTPDIHNHINIFT